MSSALSIAISAAAACFYVLTYLSFIYLLRYPRNWVAPSNLSILTCGSFFCLTLITVSFSPKGFESETFTAMLFLISALFYIIAAPAIAFRPASRPIEFFAKFGARSELVLLGLACLVFLTTDNTKLRTVILIAVVIELAWFIRQRANLRFSKIYNLTDADLSVLRTQADGDLSKFKRTHGISELNILPEGASWNGCTKWTSPCAFNLYVNRLGLNTAPCCREHMKDLVAHVVRGLVKIDAVHWLEGGTLLGAIRENGTLLDWEDDVDISVLLTDDVTWDNLATALTEHGAKEKFYVDVFPKKGFISVSYDPPSPWPIRWERNRMRGEIRADIAIYRRAVSHGQNVLERRSKKGEMPSTQNGAFGVPENVVLPTIDIDFIGGKFAGPNQPDKYLRILYGDYQRVEYTYIDPMAAQARTGYA